MVLILYFLIPGREDSALVHCIHSDVNDPPTPTPPEGSGLTWCGSLRGTASYLMSVCTRMKTRQQARLQVCSRVVFL